MIVLQSLPLQPREKSSDVPSKADALRSASVSSLGAGQRIVLAQDTYGEDCRRGQQLNNVVVFEMSG